MSIPPQLIRVKRKRDDETPVTFLQLDQTIKRHRSDSNWVYQRRGQQTAQPAPTTGRNAKPVIHVSKPDNDPSASKKRHGEAKPDKTKGDPALLAPRRFHISKAMLAASGQSPAPGVSKKSRYGPALFVERSRKKMTPKARSSLGPQQIQALAAGTVMETGELTTAEVVERPLKKPGAARKPRTPEQRQHGDEAKKHTPTAPPVNRQNEDMDRITADMNQWVLSEIGANLQSMEDDKKKEEQRHVERARFRPKAPAARYQERHPQPVTPADADKAPDTAMVDASDEEGGDDGDWVVEEYVRVPATFMAVDITPSEVGVLVLDGEEESNLFYGPLDDDDDDFDNDDEDENAENHYTADYPEDEVESDDEFDRHAYLYRNGNASDEEFDHDQYEDSDEMVLEGDYDDEARMDRIRDMMRRYKASAL